MHCEAQLCTAMTCNYTVCLASIYPATRRSCTQVHSDLLFKKHKYWFSVFRRCEIHRGLFFCQRMNSTLLHFCVRAAFSDSGFVYIHTMPCECNYHSVLVNRLENRELFGLITSQCNYQWFTQKTPQMQISRRIHEQCIAVVLFRINIVFLLVF